MTFTELGPASTRLQVHLEADFDGTVRAGAEQGWGSQLDKLTGLLAR